MYYLLILLCFLSKVNCQEVETSKDTILTIGQNSISFQCKSFTSNTPFWSFNGVQITFPDGRGCGKLEKAQEFFTLVNTSNDICTLVISNVTLNHAGNYDCSLARAYKTFIVVVTGPLTCTTNSTKTSIYNPVELKCSVIISDNGFNYTEFTWAPQENTLANISNVQNIFSSISTTSSIIVKLNPANPYHIIPSFKCTLQFKQFKYFLNSITNSIIIHYYDFENGIKISGNIENSIPFNNELVCEFNSNPGSSLSWYFSNGSSILTVSGKKITFQVHEADNYTCLVTYIDNLAGNYKNSRTIEITNVTNIPITKSTIFTSRMPDNIPLIVGLCVGLGLGIPLLLILLFCCIKKCRSPKNTKASKHNAEYNNTGYDRHPPEGEIDPYLAETRIKNEVTPALSNSDVYAELKMENNPRSRKPVQLVENGTEYATVLKA